MSAFLWRLQADLDQAHSRSLRRELHPLSRSERLIEAEGRTFLNLAGNDYLGLSSHPHLKEAATAAIAEHGTGAGASRLVVGHLDPHAEAERRLAAFKHAQSALLFATGYMANLAVLTTLPQRGDLVVMDKLNHASLIDAAYASPAAVRVFPHLGNEKLERLLQRFDQQRAEHPTSTAFIVTDGVFSMDGDCADLVRLAELARQYEAMLIVDDAHASGVLGPTGAGLAEQQGVSEAVDITISTASKALGGLGGIVTGSRLIIDSLIQRARSFIYTTAVPAAQAAAITAALDVLGAEPGRRTRLADLSEHVRVELLKDDARAHPPTPIIPVITGTSQSALALSQRLQDQGILAPAIRPPTVARGQARIRLSLRADLTDQDVSHLIDAFRKAEG